jgi:hypothetical protein
MSVNAGSLQEAVKPGAHLTGRMDAQMPILAWLTAWPLRVAGIAAIALGSLGFVLTLLSRGEGQPPVLGIDAKLFVGLVMLAVVLIGALQVFLANSVRRHARWAYALTIVIGLGVAASRLINVDATPEGMPSASLVIYRGAGWLYLAMAVLATALLVVSFINRAPDG